MLFCSTNTNSFHLRFRAGSKSPAIPSCATLQRQTDNNSTWGAVGGGAVRESGLVAYPFALPQIVNRSTTGSNISVSKYAMIVDRRGGSTLSAVLCSGLERKCIHSNVFNKNVTTLYLHGFFLSHQPVHKADMWAPGIRDSRVPPQLRPGPDQSATLGEGKPN